MYDEAFFADELGTRIRAFAQRHEGLGVRLEVVAVDGERLDVLELEPGDTGLRLVTRDDRLVFLPYANVAHVDVSLLRDYRVPSFELPNAP